MPRWESGWSGDSAPMPIMVETTGMPVFVRQRRTAPFSSGGRMPPPQQITGRLDSGNHLHRPLDLQRMAPGCAAL